MAARSTTGTTSPATVRAGSTVTSTGNLGNDLTAHNGLYGGGQFAETAPLTATSP